MNDFNWNVRISDYTARELGIVYNRITNVLESRKLVFYYHTDSQLLREFINSNFHVERTVGSKIRIDKNNFIIVYQRWLEKVKPNISINWLKAKEEGILDKDFYLADLLSQDDVTIQNKLPVILRKNHYEIVKNLYEDSFVDNNKVFFKDKQESYREFWSKYERPPKDEYVEYIIQRQDLLVPQDIRERKGSFFTPQQWVELSQSYLARTFGENWQDEYYIWDCAAGTGNLLNGLVNKHHIWCSTLDQQDIDTINQRIQNGANLLESHVFQFDFLNDEWKPQSQGGKILDDLYEIITDLEKQKKLIIYINPPYAEAGNAKTMKGTGRHKPGVAINNKAYNYFKNIIGRAAGELSTLFLAQIYDKMPTCKIGVFSTPKFIQSPKFEKFRNFFLASYQGGFMVPSWTFDNVKGKFGILFTIWDLSQKKVIQDIVCDIYNADSQLIGTKSFRGTSRASINKWIKTTRVADKDKIGYIFWNSDNFQFQEMVFIHNSDKKDALYKSVIHVRDFPIYCVYFAVRMCIKANWINNKEKFYYPDDEWEKDIAFISDCVIFTLFHRRNFVSIKEGPNHWIPFPEDMVNAKAKYEYHTMIDILEGRVSFSYSFMKVEQFRILDYLSEEANQVYRVGLELWRYYHAQPNANPNAALYDIKEYFKGRTPDGNLKLTSKDEQFNDIANRLKKSLDKLALRIAAKAYDYSFLLR